jgi:2-polyprenyl-6-methoxyphenol hydroxylase-like FAD-dependent oxidoreductase
MTQPYDVLIAGGGLAGLCLARQLTREAPSLRVFLAEKRPHPVPEAAFKVGESSVEIGAHYFQRVLDLEPHLRQRQLEKLGLRYFFPADGNRRSRRASSLDPPASLRCRRSSWIAGASRTCFSR